MKTTTLALALASFAITANAVSAQCSPPDNLDMANCCSPTNVVLPTFPNVSLQSSGFCFDSCNVTAQTCVVVDMGAPTPGPVCSEFVVPLEVNECGGSTILQGNATLHYTRKWSEKNSTGIEYDVWRFAFKTDLALAGAPICPVPTCLGPEPTAFFYGYIDYALDCGTGLFSNALALYHACDNFIHNPLFSSRPGAYHPNGSWAIVGPDTASNPFTPGFAPPPMQATPLGEAVRKVDSGVPFACATEEPIFNGTFFNYASVCACPFSFTLPPQQTASKFNGDAICGSRFQTINLFPTLPWFEMMTTSLGRWSSPTEYPGPEHASVSEAPMIYTDSCGVAGANVSVDLFYGGLTQQGFDVDLVSPVGPLNTFVDMASNYSALLPGPIPLTLFGEVQTTDHLIYTNLAF